MKLYENTALAQAIASAGSLLGYGKPEAFRFDDLELEIEKTSDYDSTLGCWVTGISLCDKLDKYDPSEVCELDRRVNDILDCMGEEDMEGEEVFSVALEGGTSARARKQDYILQAYWDGWKNVAVFPRSARGCIAAHKAMQEHECPNMQIVQYF